MKLTKNVEAEIKQVMDDYWNSYFSGDIDHWATYLVNDYRNIGGTEEEIWDSKKEIIDYTHRVIDQMKGVSEIRNKQVQIIPYDPYIMVHELMDIFIKIEDEWTFYQKFRLSSLIQQQPEGWKVLHQHGSYPDSKTLEGEAFAFNALQNENLKLQQAIKARTLELEIEASLERVRTVAMGMEKPDDILDICKVMFTELQSLGFSEIRNTLINFWDDDSSSLIDYDYSDYAGGNKAKLSYSSHPVFEQFQKKIRSSKDAFAKLVVTKDELESWKKRRLDSGEYEDPRLNNIPALYYYFYSIGVGAIGISTFSAITEEKLNVLKRFRNVFDFAYRRYADVSQAEAQTREAQIEVAVERVRAKALAMHKSEDLHSVVVALKKELMKLQIPDITAATIYLEQDDGSIRVLDLSDTAEEDDDKPQLQLDKVFHLEDTDPKLWIRRMWNRSENYFVLEADEDDFVRVVQWIKMVDPVGAEMAEKIIREKSIKKAWLPTVKLEKGVMNIDLLAPPAHEIENILLKIGAGFDLAYKRFLDLQKAEAQAREAQIELGLERVRARAMAMQNSDELAELVSVVFKELTQLEFTLTSCIIWIHDHKQSSNTLWIASAEMNKPAQPFTVEPFNEGFFQSITHAWKAKDPKWVYSLTGPEKKIFEKAFFKELPNLPYALKKALKVPKQVVFSASFNNFGALEIVETEALTDEKFEILHRFGKVFDSSFTRFNDLQKAEAQAREAQIELGLERVRARAMAMQKSDELSELVDTVFKELTKLDFALTWCIINIIDESTMSNTVWAANPDINKAPESYHMLFEDYPFHDAMMKGWKERKTKHVYILEGSEKKIYDDYLFSETEFKRTPEAAQAASRAMEKYVVSFSFSNFGGLQTVGDVPLSDANLDILSRFGKVFDLTYTRFNDLKQAEAQAREAKIEAALERVRSRTMAMQKTDELLEAAELVHKELSSLGINSMNVSYAFVDENEKFGSYYSINPVDGRILPIPFVFPHTETEVMCSILLSWKKQEFFNVIELNEKATLKHQTYIGEHIQQQLAKNNIPFSIGDFLTISPKKAVLSTFNFSKGYLFNIGGERLSKTQEELMLRFTRVFEQTYIRFLDLQKAEAQAREAQIELALERVRARTMAMQHSDELQDAAILLFQQMKALGVQTGSCGFNIWNKDEKSAIVWMSSAEGGLQTPFTMPHTESEIYKEVYEAVKKGETFLVKEVDGKNLKKHFDYLLTLPGIGDVIKKLRETGYSFPETMVYHFAFFNQGYLSFHLHEHDPEAHDIFKRFGKVFEQTYTRFLDLQKAEAQTREAKIEAALERTRTQSMIMQHSKELDDVLRVFHQQVLLLDINSAFSFLWLPDEKNDRHIFWAAWGEGKDGSTVFKSKAINYPLDRNEPATAQCLVDWKSNEPVYSYSVPPAAVENYFAVWQELIDGVEHLKPEYFSGGLYYVEAFMKYGCFGVMVATDLREDEKKILSRFAIEFERTYTRFLDLQKAEAQAREAEIQLSLERVRARSLAMHHTSELQDIVNIVAQQLYHIGMDINGGVLITINDEVDEDLPLWASSGAAEYVQKVVVPFFDRPIFTDLRDAIKKRNNFFANEYGKEEKDEMFDHLFRYAPWSSSPEERKKELLSRKGGLTRSAAISQYTSIAITNHNGKKFSEEEHEILKRFGNVFEQSYTRFLDLQKAEAQAREAQIQLALERVRASTMAMHKSDELPMSANLLFHQVHALGVPAFAAGYCIWEEDKQAITLWMSSEGVLQPPFKAPTTEDELFIQMRKGYEDGRSLHIVEMGGKELTAHYKYMLTLPVVGEIFDSINKAGHPLPAFQIMHYAYFSKGFLLIITYEPVPDAHNIFKRFAKVFEQTYTRFLDLQKAEAQAREAQIETALERVRSRSMGMQKSDELKEVIQVVYEQFVHLNINTEHTGFVMDYKLRDDRLIWVASKHGVPSRLTIPYFDCEYYNRFNEAKEKGWDFFATNLSFEDKNSFYEELFTYIPGLPEDAKEFYFSCPGLAISTVLLENVGLYIENFEGIPYSDEDNAILMRFGKVFQQTYTRFLDLQKAEAQTREAQIEAALERVRAKSMAMHSSQELKDVITVVIKQFVNLGFDLDLANFNYLSTPKEWIMWLATPDYTYPKLLKIPAFDHPLFNRPVETVTKGLNFMSDTLTHDEFRTVWQHFYNTSSLNEYDSAERKEYIAGCTGFARSIVFMKEIALTISNFKGVPYTEEQNNILRRFANVFEQTYTRFLDLQKAEAQAREAKIEAALEKVRSRTMGMQQSNELGEVATVLFKELNQLVENLWTCGFVLCEKDREEDEWWLSTGDGFIPAFYLPNTGDATHANIYDAWKKGETYHTEQLEGDALQEHYDWLMKIPVSKNIFDEMIAAGNSLPAWQKLHCAYFSYGYLVMITQVPCPEEQIFKRFAQVFDQTYTRFLDLQKAEAQVREAQIETGLERVRSKTMAMHKSEEVTGVAVSLNEELLKLGFEGGSTIIIINRNTGDTEQWTGFSEDKSLKSCYVPYFKHPCHDAVLDAWKKDEKFLVYTLAGDEKRSLDEHYFTTGYKNFPDSDKKWMREMESVTFSHAFMKYGAIHWGPNHLTEEQLRILQRFSKVFEQSYTRFLDLQKAEAQAREAEIELALERVRARTMAMQHSNEMPDAATILFQQVQSLGMPAWSAGYCIWNEDKSAVTLWMSSEGVLQPPFTAPTTEDELFIQMRKGQEDGKTFHVMEMGGDKLVKHYEYMRTLPVVGEILDSIIEAGHPLPSFQIMHHAYFSKGFLLFITYEPVPDAHDIFNRFGKVFDQTYTRFLDLQKAEAQTREAQIETVLERVRSRTMAMQKSDELTDVAGLLFEQVSALGIKTWTAGFNVWSEDNNSYVDYITSPNGGFIEPYTVLTERAEALKDISNARKSGVEFDVQYVEGEKIKQLYLALTGLGEKQFEIMLQDGVQFPSHQYEHFVFGSKVSLMFITHEAVPEAHDIFKRLGKVFEQTYTRFLDLQKAEAQAREAQIELGLERVRARAMAMQNSDELGEMVAILFEELVKLDLILARCIIWIFDNDSLAARMWMANSEDKKIARSYFIKYLDHPYYNSILYGWKEKNKKWIYDLKGDEKKTIDRLLLNETELSQLPETVKQGILSSEETFVAGSFNNFGLIEASGPAMPTDEHLDILNRFGKVFDLSYTRFNDLKQAEAQTRESQIELGLERVRARAMAMQKSDELKELIGTVSLELSKLHLDLDRCFIMIFDPETLGVTWWMSNPEEPSNPRRLFVKNHHHRPHLAYLKAWKERQLKWEYILEGKDKKSWDDFLFVETELSLLPEFVINNMKSVSKVHLSASFNNFGCLNVATLEPLSDEHFNIMLRFAKVFDLTYTRFNDLQKAEAQTRQAKIETALEKVRARALAMQEPEELKDVAEVLRHEMGLLGVEELETCSIFIHDETINRTECWYALKDIGSTEKKLVSDHFPLHLQDTWVGKEINRFFSSNAKQVSIVMQGANRKEWINYCEEKSTALRGYYGELIPDRTYHLYKFSHGAMGAASAGDISAESWDLLQRAASVFSLAYSRFKDLTQARTDLQKLKEEKQRAESALSELQTTQKQLIQSEKMASLGELTAGIAHEIQNPLNFVNNFSDVSTELVDEMNEEIEKGNIEDAKQIAKDLKQNLEKINHHGKRAGDIVKGMLQHSRSSISAVKEPTDINKLADEYLRLAYHGLRAKDKSFNASMKTDFDESIGNINIIPQDIGRVILNLITNAFYAAPLPPEGGFSDPDYKHNPTVWVSTKKVGDKVLISVKDNGPGIPKKILDKIFQPFFTTKPTGQGTGLGLSLSYDIVKAHGGELKVETKEMEGSEFIIQLPVV